MRSSTAISIPLSRPICSGRNNVYILCLQGFIISTNTIRCAKCGACTVVCPVYKASGGREAYSARGKNHLAGLPEYQRPTAAFEDIFAKCLLCGACSKACPRGIDVTREVIRARAGFSRFYGEHGFEKYLARKMLHHSEILGSMRTVGRAASRLTRRLPKDSGLRLRLAMFEPQAAKLPSLRRRAGQAACRCQKHHLFSRLFGGISLSRDRRGLPRICSPAIASIWRRLRGLAAAASPSLPPATWRGPGASPAGISRSWNGLRARSWSPAPPVSPISGSTGNSWPTTRCGGTGPRPSAAAWWR